MEHDDAYYMKLAVREALKGRGRTSPNPCVGAVIVADGKIVGRGYHRRAGSAHAEVNALADAGRRTAGATMYVTLEPCNHTGRTPPCTKAVLAAGIRRVVIGMPDPNPAVAGGGARYLEAHGVEVVTGVLAERCTAINRPFIKHVTTGLPWVILKAGMSLDGRISWQKGQGGRITGPASGRVVHRLRDRVDAILVGINTALTDDPSLTTRLENGKGQDPVRVILDSQLRLPPACRLLTQESSAETWIFCSPEADRQARSWLEQAGAVVYPVKPASDGRLDLTAVFRQLGNAGMLSVLVEGGSMVHGSLLAHNLADEVYLFVAPCFIGDAGTPLIAGYSAGGKAGTGVSLHEVQTRLLDQDVLIQGLVQKKHPIGQ